VVKIPRFLLLKDRETDMENLDKNLDKNFDEKGR